MVENIDIQKINTIAKKAGDEIMKMYQQDFEVDYKKDNSPLTEADIHSNEVIIKNLENLYPDIPILSEENKEIPYKIRKNWDYFWLIDPLDGTKEFVKKNPVLILFRDRAFRNSMECRRQGCGVYYFFPITSNFPGFSTGTIICAASATT